MKRKLSLIVLLAFVSGMVLVGCEKKEEAPPPPAPPPTNAPAP